MVANRMLEVDERLASLDEHSRSLGATRDPVDHSLEKTSYPCPTDTAAPQLMTNAP